MATETPHQPHWLKQMGRWSLKKRMFGLLVLFGLYFGLLAPLAWYQYGGLGMIALGAATGICLLTGCLALLVTAAIAPPQLTGTHVLTGMSIRMFIPLFACLFVSQRLPLWIDAGFGWYIIGAFLLNLLIDTLMSVGQLQNFALKKLDNDPKNAKSPLIN